MDQALALIAEAKRTRATTLDLGNCGLTKLPDLSGLPWLEVLVLSSEWRECHFEKFEMWSQNDGIPNNIASLVGIEVLSTLEHLVVSGSDEIWLLSDLEPLKNLFQLKKITCAGTQISNLESLENLQQLQEIDCFFTEVSDLEPLRNLPKLKIISFSNTSISDLSPLKGLADLQRIDCSSTDIHDLSPLKDLTELQMIDCSSTNVSDLSPLEDLTKLQIIDCSSTQVSDLAPLKELQELQMLNCNNTRISDLAPLKKLQQLQTLDCSSTQVSDLFPLKELQYLQSLNCNDTRVSDLSPLEESQQLQSLDCYSTQVSDLAPLKELQQLQALQCSSTQVSDLSPLKELKQLQRLQCQYCPIQNIPKEIYNQINCADALFTYWKELETAQTLRNNQLKIMFLGNGCVGKSTLLHWFLNNEFTPISLEKGRTHGIFIKPYTFKNRDVLAHFWDFGGQEVFHATHRLFLGRRSLYVLMWATESPEWNGDVQHPPQYWLDMIADIADRKERSRVLIVQNLFEGQKERNILSDEERAEYETKGLDIFTYFVDAKTGKNVKSVLSAIEEDAEQLIKTYVEELPSTWVNVRAAVAERRFTGEKMLAPADFKVICDNAGLSTTPQILLDYLHRAGELYYYNHHFENQIILDQEWALKAVYAILKRKNIDQFKGRIHREQLVEMWETDGFIQSKEEADIFLDFMLANQIAFYTDKGSRKIKNPELAIPQLLPPEPPRRRQTWEKIPEKIRHRIVYHFLHRDIVERFIVRTAHLSKNTAEDIWRNGLFIEYGRDSEALIEVIENEGKKQIQIECCGTVANELLLKIREEFNNIRRLEKAVEWTEQDGQWGIFSDKIQLKTGEIGGFEPPLHNHNHTTITQNMTIKAHLINLITEGKLKEALDIMYRVRDNQSDYYVNPLIGLLSRYSRNERDQNAGIIDLRDYRIEYSKIEKSVKSLLDSEFSEERVPEKIKKEILDAGKSQQTYTTTSPSTSNPTTQPQIYFSYAWGDDKEVTESREKIVQDLYDELKKEGYHVQRDKEAVGYKDSIEEFMKEIGRGSFIVVTISDKYLKSANCMFELLQIYRKSKSDFKEFKDKIFPIVLSDAKIYDPLDVLDYSTYWQDKKNKLEDKIKVVGLAAASGVMADFDKFNEITNNIAQISRMISSINTLKPQLLSKDNFAEIKKAIAEKIK